MKLVGPVLAILALCASPAAPAAAAAQPFPAEEFAAFIQADLPREFGPGMRLVEARAEGGVVVFLFEMPAAARRTITTEAMTEQIRRGFCAGAEAQGFFDQGLRLRVDTRTEDGVRTPGIVIATCAA